MDYEDYLTLVYLAELEDEKSIQQDEYHLNELEHYARIAYATNKWVNVNGEIVDLMCIDDNYFENIMNMFENKNLLDSKRISHLKERRNKL